MPDMEETSMCTEPNETDFDVIVVGGSYAGLSAALQLARARRRVLVIDSGRRRNRHADRSHGFLTQDGTEAAALAAQGRDQLRAYPNVAWAHDTAVGATAAGAGFAVALPGGGSVRGRRLILATGVTDTLPPVGGLEARWGKSVFHCPYCHGYELDGGAIGVLAAGPGSLHQALMLPDWGRVTLLLNGAFDPDPVQLEALARRGVTVERTPVARIEGRADVVLADGRRLPLAGLFVTPRTQIASPLAQQLGCALEDGPTGQYVATDAHKASSVPGVFCCGDLARPAGNVALAVADGALAGIAAHRSLIPELAAVA
jgi:thioredoxin reductase